MADSAAEDWDRDEGHALLKRRKSMDFAQNQLAVLEAKYSGQGFNQEIEKRLVGMCQRVQAGDEEHSIFTVRAGHCVVSVFSEPIFDSTPINTVVVSYTAEDLPEVGDVPYEQVPAVSLKADSRSNINKLFFVEAGLLIPELEKTLGTSSGAVSVFTGYSLGGAIATVLAWYWEQPTTLVTFGSPRVGDREFVFETLDNVKKSSRYVFGEDVVALTLPISRPMLPVLACFMPREGELYRHIGPELHIWSDEVGDHREVIKKRKAEELVQLVYEECVEDHVLGNYLMAFQNTIIDHTQ